MTCSRSTQVLPSSIYLSHQFSFFALESDHHALFRRNHFDVPAERIDVRKEVEASVYDPTSGESFLQAGSSPQDIRCPPLDGPLASAISAGLNYSGRTTPIIPMLPNGGRPGSFNAAIPIRNVAVNLSEGVNEGFGRLRREIKKVRSPRLRPRRSEDHIPVPLEFDEDDEAFLSNIDTDIREDDVNSFSGATSHGAGDSGSNSLSTPSTNNNAPLPDDVDGWGPTDMQALDEVEQFDEISAAGLMDEDHFPVLAQQKSSGRKY